MPRIFYILLFATAATTSACTGGSQSQPAPLSEHCETVATQCRLPGGALGVCHYDTESNLKCMSQH